MGHLRAKAITFSVLAVLVAGCSPGPEHYVEVLDEIAIPQSWELVYIIVNSPGGADVGSDPGVPRKLTDCAIGDCPLFGRYYVVDGLPVDVYPGARQLLIDAGFALDLDSGPECDLLPSSAACVVGGRKGSDHIQVSLYNAGDEDGNVQVSNPTGALVRLFAAKN